MEKREEFESKLACRARMVLMSRMSPAGSGLQSAPVNGLIRGRDTRIQQGLCVPPPGHIFSVFIQYFLVFLPLFHLLKLLCSIAACIRLA